MSERDRTDRLIRAAWLSILTLAAACGDDAATGSGGGGAGGAPSAGGQLASGGAPGGGGAGEVGGAGGAPAGCSPYEPESCAEGLHCVVEDDALGLDGGTSCLAPGAGATFSACAGDADCAAGTLCDRVTSTCKPACEIDADCGDGACVSAQSSAGAEIPGLKLCLAGCDPVANAPCGAAGAEVGCLYRADLEAFDCALAGNEPEATACSEQAECAVDLGCLEVNGESGCLHWCVYDGGTDICTAEEHPDAQFAICVPQSPSIAVDGVVYGGCLKQL